MDEASPTSLVLLDLPEELVGPRVVVRCYRPGDGAALYEAVDELRAHLAPWMPWVDAHRNPSDSEVYARGARARWFLRQEMPMAVFDRATARFLGSTGLRRADWQVPSVEIGYWLRASAEHFGYMTESVQLVCGMAFEALGAKRVHIRCDSRNERSAAIPRRLGFVLEATLRNDARSLSGDLRDTLVFGAIPEDYTRLRNTWLAAAGDMAAMK